MIKTLKAMMKKEPAVQIGLCAIFALAWAAMFLAIGGALTHKKATVDSIMWTHTVATEEYDSTQDRWIAVKTETAFGAKGEEYAPYTAEDTDGTRVVETASYTISFTMGNGKSYTYEVTEPLYEMIQTGDTITVHRINAGRNFNIDKINGKWVD